MFTMQSIDDLWDHIAYVMGYAPSGFPYRDFLPADQQMNLDRAFEQLRQGVHIAYPEDQYADRRDELFELLKRSHDAWGWNSYWTWKLMRCSSDWEDMLITCPWSNGRPLNSWSPLSTM